MIMTGGAMQYCDSPLDLNCRVQLFLVWQSMSDFEVAATVPHRVPAWCLTTCDEACQVTFYYYGFIVSSIFSVLTMAICLYNAYRHFTNFNNPYFQSKIVVIILMPPVYCLTSTLSFLSVRWSSYITLARDLYEMLGLFAFFYLILSFIAFDHSNNKLDEKKVYQEMCSNSSEISHDSPCNYFQKPYQLSSWHKAQFFVTRCKRAILQFIIIKIATSILLCLVYPEFQLRIRVQSDWDYKIYNKVNTYIYWITTLSSYIAYYYMSMFYNSIHERLRPYRPDLKFMTFNSTMYYTYWQKVWMMFFQNRITACFDLSAHIYYSKKLMYCVENFLICIEMFFMALAILEAYNYEDYVVHTSQKRIGSVAYILKDLFMIFKIELRLVRPHPLGFKSTKDLNQTELLTIDSLKNTDRYKIKVKVRKPIQDSLIQYYF